MPFLTILMLLHFVQRCVMTLWIMMMVLLLVIFSTPNTIWWSIISQHITTTRAFTFEENL
ncbi:MAG: hypothetical protein B6I35_04625 [Anaerolineaceae bacterium 4572_32.2]|nr:MAG: hypothetical protein B6I35_04625 [Anaerolineaceae bacterium 4572_32.2]RLC79288.1 MAG: hypothetical protein DRI81_05480 [Chloroflexota bacterium]